MNIKQHVNSSLSAKSCVSDKGTFIVGIHRPAFDVELFRANSYVDSLGTLSDGTVIKNQANFPAKRIEEKEADLIYEIPNPFPFRGTTYINSAWADGKVGKPEQICLPPTPDCSLSKMLNQWFTDQNLNYMSENQQIKNQETTYLPENQEMNRDSLHDFFIKMPSSLKIALAQSTTDPEDLLYLLPLCCTFLFDKRGNPSGLLFKKRSNGRVMPDIQDHTLFDVIANNPALPDIYKRVMVLKPGIQGGSEITGEWLENSLDEDSLNEDSLKNGLETENLRHTKHGSKSHVFEYLRRNSYIPWGHFAANTADDVVRYSIKDLTMSDMSGMRHLYYQRTYLRLAEQLNICAPESGKTISPAMLEQFRFDIIHRLEENMNTNVHTPLLFNASLWGWNFGFDCAQSGYRLHASHQQIHQQYAMIHSQLPEQISNTDTSGKYTIPSYSCGDLVADFIASYRNSTGKQFFDNYILAVRSNNRTDGRNRINIKNSVDEINRTDGCARCTDEKSLPSSLIVYEDENVLLFVPKAQTSQWELQLMTLKQCGNILEADLGMRTSLDRAMLLALQILEKMGARMVTSIEFSKRFDSIDRDQRLMYAFMPRLPESPGAFSEAQLRWINGHYPEDFAEACRKRLAEVI
ncbi:MAG: hypothetical protein HQK67_10660 [Desulfamplus sp.]|nr:hypothetical protein [Desulfamplus sp.]